MAKPVADISTFQIKPVKPTVRAEETSENDDGQKLKLKGFYVKPEMELQFDILKRKSGKKGPALIHEALNLLFKEYGMRTVD